jgi:4-amino-4-deoxy-L-arabinose transferase-like glycosyltransferase
MSLLKREGTTIGKEQPSFPAKAWSRRDWLLLGILAVSGCILFWSGLSVRSLWGPEGRWAMIVREMMRSGDYFAPSVNGVIDLDKPLLTYWAVLPFAKVFGLTEFTLRIPSTLAAVSLVLLIFAIGRRLFGVRVGMIAALLLLASPLFVLWARTASAELFNSLAIWAVFWAFLAGAYDGKLRYLLLLYGIGAVASFLKGPVAPAVSLSSLSLYSFVGVLLQPAGPRAVPNGLNETLVAEFGWFASRRALVGLLTGATVFLSLLMVPIVSTGSWASAVLMWQENVTRFLFPFDHTDPPYVYIIQVLLFCAPWSFLMVGSLWNGMRGKADRGSRWALLSALGIFLFFTLSGSRRGYYILPLIPALALITGKTLGDWMDGGKNINPRLMCIAALITSLLVVLAGCGLIYVCSTIEVFRDTSLRVFAPVAMIGGGVCLVLFLKMPRKGLIAFLIVVLFFEFLGFTRGMELLEKRRTLHYFAEEVTKSLSGVSDDRVSIFQGGKASLLFYLNRASVIRNVNTVAEIERFTHEHPDGFLLIDLDEATAPGMIGCLQQMSVVAIQGADANGDTNHFALLRFH